MTSQIIIEDNVVPQLLTSAIEAYEIQHKSHEHGKAKASIETYGLLWGHIIPSRHGLPQRIVSTIATVETSALRHEEWVLPNIDSLKMKRDFFQKYWPQLELVGTFHSHPYDRLSEVNDAKGWRASLGDREHWPEIHKELSPELPSMAHLIITITALEKKGWALPQPLPQGERNTGFVLSSDNRKLWIKAYTTDISSNDQDHLTKSTCICSSDYDAKLNIPALMQRFTV